MGAIFVGSIVPNGANDTIINTYVNPFGLVLEVSTLTMPGMRNISLTNFSTIATEQGLDPQKLMAVVSNGNSLASGAGITLSAEIIHTVSPVRLALTSWSTKDSTYSSDGVWNVILFCGLL